MRALAGRRPVRLSAISLIIGALAIMTATAGTAVSLSHAKLKLINKDGTIHQCVNDKTYVTRTVPRGKHCSSKETALSFNQTGPRGKTGEAGSPETAFADDNAGAPIAVPATDSVFVLKHVSLKLAKPGEIIVLNATLHSATIDNTTNQNQTYIAAVLIDNKSVPGTVPQDISVPPNSGNHNISGFSNPPGELAVAAGTHTVELAMLTSDTTANYFTSSSAALLAIAG